MVIKISTKYDLNAKVVLGSNIGRLGEKNSAKYKSWVNKTVAEVFKTGQGSVDITYAIKVKGIQEVPSAK